MNIHTDLFKPYRLQEITENITLRNTQLYNGRQLSNANGFICNIS